MSMLDSSSQGGDCGCSRGKSEEQYEEQTDPSFSPAEDSESSDEYWLDEAALPLTTDPIRRGGGGGPSTS